MPLVAATRIQAKSWRHTLAFLLAVTPHAVRAQRAPGFLSGGVLWMRNLDSFTVSVWEDAASMRAFRNGRQHLKAIPRWPRYGHASTFATWHSESTRRPPWSEVAQRLTSNGRWPDGPDASGDQLREQFPVTHARGITYPWIRLRRRKGAGSAINGKGKQD